MIGVGGAILGAAGISALGGLAGGLLGAKGASDANAASAKSSKRSIAFQREMAQNAHQYEVADLRAAGLNPILSGTGGPGARASGGAQYTAQNELKDAGDKIANSAKSAADASLMYHSLKSTKATTAATEAQRKIAEEQLNQLKTEMPTKLLKGKISELQLKAIIAAEETTTATARELLQKFETWQNEAPARAKAKKKLRKKRKTGAQKEMNVLYGDEAGY